MKVTQLFISVNFGAPWVLSLYCPQQIAQIYVFSGYNFDQCLPKLKKFLAKKNFDIINLLINKNLQQDSRLIWKMAEHCGFFMSYLQFFMTDIKINKYEMDKNQVFRGIFPKVTGVSCAEKNIMIVKKYLNKNLAVANSLMILDYFLKKRYNVKQGDRDE